MSVDAIGWAFRMDTGDMTAKCVLLAMANHADQEDRCWPSQKKLAAMCTTTDRTVRAAIVRLEGRGLIVRHKRFRENGGNSSDMFVLQTHVGAPASGGGPDPPSGRVVTPASAPPPEGASGLTSLEPSSTEPSIEPSETLAGALELIWKAVPPVARQRSTRGELEKALRTAAGQGHKFPAILVGVRAAYDSYDFTKENCRYAPGVHRIVNDGRWESFVTTAEVVDLFDSMETPAPWRQRKWMQDWLENQDWWKPHERGPTPDEAGCRVTPEIMAEFDYTPKGRRQA